MATRAQSENCHAEGIKRVQTCLAEPEELIERESKLGCEIAEVTLHHFARERVVSGRHRRVGCENIGGGDRREAQIKIEAFSGDMRANSLEGEKRIRLHIAGKGLDFYAA